MNPFLWTNFHLSEEDLALSLSDTYKLPEGLADSGLKLLGAGGRDWQLEAYEKLKGTRFSYFTAFMGSGKSLLMKYLATYDILANGGNQKQVVIIPYVHLQKGFTNNYIEINGQQWYWDLGLNRNLCDPKKNIEGRVNVTKLGLSGSTRSVVDELKRAILEPLDAYADNYANRNLYGRVILTTDHAMALAWRSMSDDEKEIAVGNHPDFGITYNKDEAHRVLMPSEFEAEMDEADAFASADCNILGEMMSRVVTSKCGNIRLTSGTFVRGDQKRTILGGFESLFEKNVYEQDFVKYFKTLGVGSFHMTSYVYQVEPGMGDLFAFLRRHIETMSKQKRKWMLMLPHYNKGWRREGGFDASTRYGANLIFDLLYEFYPKHRVLNFVDPHTREKQRPILDSEPEDGQTHESNVDVIVGVDSLSVGVDWPSCSVVVNTVNDQSIIMLLQKPGRAFRRFKDKQNIDVITCIPQFKPKQDLSIREVISDHTNQVLSHFFMKDMFEPLSFTGINNNVERLRDWWRTGGKYEQVFKDISERFEALKWLKPKLTVNEEEAYMEIEDIILRHDAHFPPEELRRVAKAIITRYVHISTGIPKARPILTREGIHFRDAHDVSFIREDEEFDKMTFGDLRNYKGEFTSGEFEQIQSIVKEYFQWDSFFEEADRIFQKSPQLKTFLIEGLSRPTIQWSQLDVVPRTEEVLRWAVSQYKGRNLLPSLQKKKVEALFYVPPKPPTQYFVPPVRPVMRRPSYG